MERRSASRNPGHQLNNIADNKADPVPSSPTRPIKRELTTPAPVTHTLASSVAQSLSSYEHLIAERRHRSVFTSLAERCPVFKDVPNTSLAPTLVELARDAPGVPLYITSPDSYRNSSSVRIPHSLLPKLADPSLRGFLTFGTEKMRRRMCLGIFKFLLWQCDAISCLKDVSRHSYALDWEGFVQLVHSSGHRLVNLPARALYPNGLLHSSPNAYPSEVLDDVIRQFAHSDPRKRFGVINRRHDHSALPLMSKVCCIISEHSMEPQPIEWSAVGRQVAPPIASSSALCRCNLCIDSSFEGTENRLGEQLVTLIDALQAAAQWEARWEFTHEVFDLSHFPLDAQDEEAVQSNSNSTSKASTMFDGVVLPSGGSGNESEVYYPSNEGIPGVLFNGRFIPTFVSRNLEDDEDDVSVYQPPPDSSARDNTSDASSSCSDLSAVDMLDDTNAGDPTEITLDIPNLRSAEIEWDIEDFEIERKRAAEDVDLKRRREEEDRVREVQRKRARITMAAEYSVECIAKEREEEDRRREEARRRQDEELRARLQARLEAIQ
ncbi:hypothetical protein FS837_002353 [Tulasnella sp. UAMH 9824]|nr:hypothetical protein FS837_002353 [Tulasnella sp. UAMH 9824]